jgi:hypothetical protein
MGVSGQLHVPVDLPMEKNLPLPVEKKVGWASQLFWTFLTTENCLASAENRTSILWWLSSL